MKKRIWALLMAGILVFSSLMVGCGRDDEEKSKISQGEGPWYKAQYHDFVMGKNEYINISRVYEDAMYFSTMEFVEEAGESFTKVKKMNLDDFSVTEIEGITLEEDSHIADMYVDDTGIYLAIQRMKYNQDYTELLEAEYTISQYDFDGMKVNTMDITEEMKGRNQDGMYAYISNIVRDKEGNLIFTDSNTFILAYDKDGKKIADIELTDWGNGLVVSEDGTAYYSYMDDVNWEQVLAPVDFKTGKLGENIGKIGGNSNDCYMDANQVVWMTEENNLVTYDLPNEEKNVVLNWLDYNVNGSSVMTIKVFKDGRIVAFTADYTQDGENYEVVILEESDEPLSEKIVLTYATLGTDSEISEAIIRFNKNNEKYRIKVVDYFDESQEYESSFDAYNEAVLSGDVADIINVDMTQYKSMARKGLYADLNELLENDADINRKDYFENVLKAYEIDGKLYAMPTSFAVSTLMGSKEVWGDKENVTLKDLKSVMDSVPQNVTLMDYMSKNYFMFTMTQGMIGNFVNWETGECSFDSEEFIAVLEMANTFPKEFNYENQTMSTPEKLQSGNVLLYGEAFYEISGYQVAKEFFNGESVVIGYPEVAGNGGLIQNTGNLLAISNESEYKEAAWEFVKYLISEEYQSNYIYWQNPIHKGAFDKLMVKAGEKEYYTDENGEQVESPKMTYGWDNFEVSVYAATEQDIKEYTEILEGATVLASYEEEIMNMINEEVEPFFDGKKTAAEVANIIQGRVKIYVNESR